MCENKTVSAENIKVYERLQKKCNLYINYKIIQRLLLLTDLDEFVFHERPWLKEFLELAVNFTLVDIIEGCEKEAEAAGPKEETGLDVIRDMIDQLEIVTGLPREVLYGERQINLGIIPAKKAAPFVNMSMDDMESYLERTNEILEKYDLSDKNDGELSGRMVELYRRMFFEDAGFCSSINYEPVCRLIGHGIGAYRIPEPMDPEAEMDTIRQDMDGLLMNPLGINHAGAYFCVTSVMLPDDELLSIMKRAMLEAKKKIAADGKDTQYSFAKILQVALTTDVMSGIYAKLNRKWLEAFKPMKLKQIGIHYRTSEDEMLDAKKAEVQRREKDIKNLKEEIKSTLYPMNVEALEHRLHEIERLHTVAQAAVMRQQTIVRKSQKDIKKSIKAGEKPGVNILDEEYQREIVIWQQNIYSLDNLIYAIIEPLGLYDSHYAMQMYTRNKRKGKYGGFDYHRIGTKDDAKKPTYDGRKLLRIVAPFAIDTETSELYQMITHMQETYPVTYQGRCYFDEIYSSDIQTEIRHWQDILKEQREVLSEFISVCKKPLKKAAAKRTPRENDIVWYCGLLETEYQALETDILPYLEDLAVMQTLYDSNPAQWLKNYMARLDTEEAAIDDAIKIVQLSDRSAQVGLQRLQEDKKTVVDETEILACEEEEKELTEALYTARRNYRSLIGRLEIIHAVRKEAAISMEKKAESPTIMVCIPYDPEIRAGKYWKEFSLHFLKKENDAENFAANIKKIRARTK